MEEKNLFLSEAEKQELISCHKSLKNKQLADRIKCLYIFSLALKLLTDIKRSSRKMALMA